MSPHRILVVDDDADIRGLLRELLERRGFSVTEAMDGRQALQEFYGGRPDLVLLDVGMPAMDGWMTLERIRELSDVPVVMLTARSTELEKTRGLRAGADDYVTKPFAFEELLARVEALARRPRAIASPALRVADLELKRDTREVFRGGELIELTPKEYTVLEYLMRHHGRVMSRTLITEYAWGYHFDPGTNIVDVVINHLRKKIDSKQDKKLIHTVRGVGYSIRE
jgi:DNA-binding response OmpR family regulator